MASKVTMKNQLKEMLVALSEDEYPVHGWNFTLDDDSKFNPFCEESSTKAGFPPRFGMPECEGFFYVSKEYLVYLQFLLDTDTDHPANIDNLEWTVHDNSPLATI